MSKHIPVPPELQHLIEKREQELDRRTANEPPRDDGEAPVNPPTRPERRRKSERRRKPKSNS